MIDITKFEFDDTFSEVTVTAKVPDEAYWEDVYIDEIIIGTQNAYDTSKGDFKPLESDAVSFSNENHYTETKGKYAVKFKLEDGQEGLKELTVSLPIDTTNIKVTDLFFVKVTDAGDYSQAEDGALPPCQIQARYTWSSIYNRFTMDVKGMNYLTELTKNCETPDGFIDYILNRQALDVAADCGDYTAMIARYNDMNGQSSTSSSSSRRGCGCL